MNAARNYAQAEAASFKDVDVLPLTGQQAHYSPDKKSHPSDYVTESAASLTAWIAGMKIYNGTLSA
ncbi:alkaline phosphatase [Enterobacter sp. R1(2018)]|uniref:alkaline phosphatase n=1 Tax=Enterobacter sp. R1(2018) TaxID=2447891 RepID=UPI00217ED907|nr:alkaline phosphatase [Enterobacter sp. R1(2018)]